ncbi:PAS domain-containing protein [Fulvivirgaceae bacterium PWU4]|uniref:histidine kinase n=1 Tax=Chryseosolibacter histidini TaxID=2782349 RepID=A0AAP2DLX3_9BACT|nr:PAS domain-containing protein [Chryseosolibacter histidini]MBT1697693.1 PAS domain-containing protein [Chryseosolibacter histidini]
MESVDKSPAGDAIESNVRNLFEHAPALICVLRGREGRCEIFNPPLAKWWGYRDVMQRTMREAWPELEGRHIFEIVEKVYDTGQTHYLNEFRAEVIKENITSHFFFNFVFTPFFPSPGRIDGVMIFGHDVTDIVSARKKTEESRLELIQMADAMPQLVWITNANGAITYINKRIWEFAAAKSFVPGSVALQDLVYGEDKPLVDTAWKRAISTGESYAQEHRMPMKDGAVKWHLSRAYPYRDAGGNVLKWFGTTTDIDDQKQIASQLEKRVKERTQELTEANADLERSNQELEQFAYVVSHDLQEPLRKIRSFGEVLKNNHGASLGTAGEDIVRRMQTASERMRQLIDDLLAYAKISRNAHSRQVVDPAAIITDVLTDLETTMLEKNARVEVGRLYPVSGDAVKLRQLFQNLISNAIKFSKHDTAPRITITAELVTGANSGFRLAPELNQKQFQCITVADNGIGFSSDDADKIFQLFHRLHGHKEYAGSGVGLSIVQKVMEIHHGYVMAEGKPGSGAVFRLLFPCNEAEL